MPRKPKVSEVAEAAVAAIEKAGPVEEESPLPWHEEASNLPAPTVAAAEPTTPVPGEPGWQEYVMGQFEPGDFDPDGNPGAEAARIVVERLLGPITSEIPQVLQVPTAENGYRASVMVLVTVAWGGDRGDSRTFGDVADADPRHMNATFAKHALATAKTKAMGRACKAALKLKKVYVAEEMSPNGTPVAVTAVNSAEILEESQVRFIDKMCRTLDIDVIKFINCGASSYSSIADVPNSTAKAMCETLDFFQKERGKIPATIRGYDSDWRQKEDA